MKLTVEAVYKRRINLFASRRSLLQPLDNTSFFLRLGNEILAPILPVYFGLAFELGFFPQIFKTAKVVPIFKAGDKHLVRNYRPISLLSCLSKVLEKVIKNQCINFFEKHEIFYDF